MNCIILGDKYQQRMKSKGCAGLIKINKKYNILLNQYEILKSTFKNINIIYIYGFDDKKFLDFIKSSKLDISIKFNSNYNIYNQAFSLSLVKDDLINDDLLIIDGYQKLNKNMFKKFDFNKGSSTFIKNMHSNINESIGCIIANGYIEHFSFDLQNSIYNIYYLEKKCVNSLLNILKQVKYHNNFIFELINKLIDQGFKNMAVI